MNFDRINEQLHKIKTTKKIEDIHTLIGFLVESFGITQSNPEELFMHASVQREVSRFMPAQGFRNQAAAYTIPHQSGIPLDIKLFWMKKTTKANLSWIMALTPNYEDNPETNANLNIGIDIVVSENCDSVFIVLSNNLKARVLELNGLLSLTQREIFDNWVKIGRTINRESEHFKKEFHTLLWKSFDFEPINRKFYLQLVEQFDHLVGHLKKNIDEEPAKMFAVRLIGRTLFLWFLRKKEFVNPEFDYFTVSGDADQTEYYREKLEPLFFEVLNTEIKERSFADKITPFLNGGLFEPIDTDFYKDSKLTFPTGFFTQIFNVLNHYNFTVDEGTSEYEQVAVDPEMLGRVFENLLASLNDETGNQARKSKGAFYTPREIVDYMCEQSLVEYLKTKLPETANRDRRIEELVTMDEASFREQDHNKRRDWKKDLGQEQVVQALDELKILDPAVGSGAFPMGMLNLLVKVYTRIDTAREKDLAQLKRDILSRSLYGVDIDQMAIQISRLRAWLSILVDMENLKKAEPLPNLDFKFVCANTLIPLAGLDATNLFDETDLKQDLIKIRDAYYSENRKSFKKKLRDQYLERIKDGGLFAELESERQRQLKDYNPFNPLNSSSFYDPTLMHGVEVFDVVIGNPPYVRQEKFTEIKDSLKKTFGNFFNGRADLYTFFIKAGFSFLSQNGIFSYITSNKFFVRGYGENTRSFLSKEISLFKIINFGELPVFKASVDSAILIAKNIHPKNGHVFEYVQVKNAEDIKNLNNFFNKKKEVLEVESLGIDEWSLQDSYKLKILNKIKSNNVTLESFYERKIFGGIKTGYDDAFVISEDIKNNLINKDPKSAELIKPWLRGKDVRKWKVDYKNLYIIYIPLNKIKIDDYPVIKEHLLKYKTILESRATKQQWYEIQQPQERFSKFFDQFKIIYPDCAKEMRASYDDTGAYGTMAMYFIPYDPIIMGILNSKLFDWYARMSFASFGDPWNGGRLIFKTIYMSKIPIPEIKTKEKISIEIKRIVEDILKNKKNNSSVNISNLESQVDELVMNLYGLNEEEKEIIRNS